MNRTRPWIACAVPEATTSDLKRAYDKIRQTHGAIPQIRAVMAGEPLTVEGFAYFTSSAARVAVS